MGKRKWIRVKGDTVDGRIIWKTTDDDYGLVVNPMAWGKNKWHVGYNYISNPNFVTLGSDVTKQEALTIANKFRKTH